MPQVEYIKELCEKEGLSRLQKEHGYKGSYATVKRYVNRKKAEMKKCKERFLPLAHPPGYAQVDIAYTYRCAMQKASLIKSMPIILDGGTSRPHALSIFIRISAKFAADAWRQAKEYAAHVKGIENWTAGVSFDGQ